MNRSSLSTGMQIPVFAGGGKINFGEKRVPNPGNGQLLIQNLIATVLSITGNTRSLKRKY